MRRLGIGSALGLLATGTAQAEAPKLAPIPAAQAPGYERIREVDLRADLTFIASDALLGRMSLQPGDEILHRWRPQPRAADHDDLVAQRPLASQSRQRRAGLETQRRAGLALVGLGGACQEVQHPVEGHEEERSPAERTRRRS